MFVVAAALLYLFVDRQRHLHDAVAVDEVAVAEVAVDVGSVDEVAVDEAPASVVAESDEYVPKDE
jgi:hypothetical protein